MSIKNNTDVLSIILYHLRYHKQSLHSCLLVNRFWCSLTIPILWRDPWIFFYRLDNILTTPTQPASLINAYISSLPQESIIELHESGINIPIYQTPSSFNYPIYLRGLDLNYLYKLISRWISEKNNEKPPARRFQKAVSCLKKFGKKVTGRDDSLGTTDYDDKTKRDQILLVCSKLLLLFFKKSPMLRLIRIKPKKHDVTYLFEEGLMNFYEAKNCLSNLTGLECVDDPYMEKIYTQLALSNTNISQIMIHGCKSTKSFAKLLSVQKKLQKLYLVNITTMTPITYWTTPGVGLELQKKACNITKLKLESSCSFLELLQDFINLEEFSLRCVHRLPCYDRKPLKAPYLRNLKKLQFEYDHKYEIKFIANLIGHTHQLKKVIIEGSRISDPNNCHLLLDSIITCCHDLKNCSIPISIINPPLTALLESCKYIQRLCLFSVPSETQININYCDNFLFQVLNSNPVKLHTLELINCSFSVKVWQTFLKTQCMTNLRSVSYLWMKHNFQPSEEFLEICSMYKHLGMLKTFGNINLYRSCLFPKFHLRID